MTLEELLKRATPKVKPLVWVDFDGRGAKASAWLQANYMISRWSDGQFELSASYPGYSSGIDGAAMFHPTLEDAKAAAQADHEARILSALEPPDTTLAAALIEVRRIADQAKCDCAEGKPISAFNVANNILTRIDAIMEQEDRTDA